MPLPALLLLGPFFLRHRLDGLEALGLEVLLETRGVLGHQRLEILARGREPLSQRLLIGELRLGGPAVETIDRAIQSAELLAQLLLAGEPAFASRGQPLMDLVETVGE